MALSAGCVTGGAGALDAAATGRSAEREERLLLARVKVYDDPPLTDYLTQIAGRVLGPSGARGVRITVIEDPTLAAFAMPGGRVFVHTGLLAVVENEAQLALILARELSHDPATPGARARKPPLATVPLGPTAAAVLGLDLELTARAAIDGYGPDGERAADVDGVRRLAAAGYDPSEAAGIFRRLAGDGADRGGLAEIFFYGDRGRMAERDESVREIVVQTGAGSGEVDPGRARKFASRLRPLVRDNAALDLRAGRFGLARRQLDRVLAADPDDPIARLHEGDLHRLRSQRASGAARAREIGQALEGYERAIALDPGYAEPFRQLALLRYERRDVAGARAAFERYLALRPDAPDAPRIREYLAVLGEQGGAGP